MKGNSKMIRSMVMVLTTSQTETAMKGSLLKGYIMAKDATVTLEDLGTMESGSTERRKAKGS